MLALQMSLPGNLPEIILYKMTAILTFSDVKKVKIVTNSNFSFTFGNLACQSIIRNTNTVNISLIHVLKSTIVSP